MNLRCLFSGHKPSGRGPRGMAIVSCLRCGKWPLKEKPRSKEAARAKLEGLLNEGLESALSSSAPGHQSRPASAESEAMTVQQGLELSMHILGACSCRVGRL